MAGSPKDVEKKITEDKAEQELLASACVTEPKYALETACITGNVDDVRNILANKHPGLDINTNLYGRTPLMIAALYGRKDLVEFLLQQPECDVSLAISCKNIPGLQITALYCALNPLENFAGAHYEIAALLVQADKGAILKQFNLTQGNLLETAWMLGNQRAAQQLISLGAELKKSENFIRDKAILGRESKATQEERENAARRLLILCQMIKRDASLSNTEERDTFENVLTLLDTSLVNLYAQENPDASNPEGIEDQIKTSRQFVASLCNKSHDKPYPSPTGTSLVAWEATKKKGKPEKTSGITPSYRTKPG